MKSRFHESCCHLLRDIWKTACRTKVQKVPLSNCLMPMSTSKHRNFIIIIFILRFSCFFFFFYQLLKARFDLSAKLRFSFSFRFRRNFAKTWKSFWICLQSIIYWEIFFLIIAYSSRWFNVCTISFSKLFDHSRREMNLLLDEFYPSEDISFSSNFKMIYNFYQMKLNSLKL